MPPKGNEDEAKSLNKETDPALTKSGGKAFQTERTVTHTKAEKPVRALTWLTAPTTLRALEGRASQNWTQRGS